MPTNSRNSLLTETKHLYQYANSNTAIKKLVMEIKTEYKNNGSWSSSSVKKLKIIESNLSNFIYKKYSSNKPIDASGLTIEEQKEYLDKFKLLAENNSNIEIRIQGKNEDYFSHLSDSDLLDGDAYRLLPKDFNGRYNNNSILMSRLTINVKKEHYFSLAEALVYLYERDPHNKIMQSKIMGPKKLGNLTDQAVIYFPNASLQDAIEIANELKELLPEDAFVEHVPIGMHRIDKGISYSETLKNQSSSHGEVRAEIMAKAVSESLLTGKPVEECLDHQLSIYGYSVENPALISQSVREASHDISLAGSSNRVDVLPSKDIDIFKQDPISFSQQYILNAKELNKILQLPSEGKVIFNKKIGHGYFIEYVDDSYRNDDFNSIDCYFLESKMRSKDSKQVEYVDIPKKNSEIQFLFTGQLRGGSIIVTELNSETYRVYRDNRSDASLLYDNVVMAIDERDYNIKEHNITKASVFMHYNDGEWNLIFQPQRNDSSLNPESNMIIRQKPGDYSRKQRMHDFYIYRNKIHQELKDLASNLNIIFSDIPESEDMLQEPLEQSASVNTWLDIGEHVKLKLDIQNNKLNEKCKFLEFELSKTTDNKKRQYLENLIKTNKTIISLNKRKYGNLLYALREVERSWIWINAKEKNGTDAVVQVIDYDENIELNASSDYHLTINERYENLIYLHKLTRNLRFKNEFSLGVENYKEINIPGFDISMNSNQLKKMYVTGEYSAKERGALYRQIQDVSYSEYISKVLSQTGKISELFSSLGSKTNRLIPQDFYLSLIRSDSGGRCYPLVRTMSVALALNGHTGADRFIDKLYMAAAAPESKDALLLQSSLKNLHSNVSAVESSFSHGVMELKKIQTLLDINEETKMFAMNSKSHSMLVGKVVENEKSTYYFYDPNFGLFSFKNSKRLFAALKVFFIDKKMASYYSAFERNNKPAFELVFIDVGRMKDVPIGNHLTVNDLVSSEELSIKSLREKEIEDLFYQQNEIIHDTQLKTSLVILDAEQWAENIDESLTILTTENKLDENWVPLFSSVESLGNENYKIQFVNIKDSKLTCWVETKDSVFMRFQRHSLEQMGIFRQYYTFEENHLREKFGEASSSSFDGLNAGIAIQSIIQWAEEKNHNNVSKGKISSNLYLALKIHSYVNYSMMAHGAMNDIVKINGIVKLELAQENEIAGKGMNFFFSSMTKTANEGMTVIFSGALVGFDAYELSNAENDPERIIFGTQLAFDSASFAAGSGGIGLGIAGCAGAASALGSASVLVAGLGIGFVGLARNFAIIGEDAKAVGRYFYTLDEAYKGNGFDYISDKNMLIPKFGAVFSTISLRDNKIEFDSQYIYRTKPNSAGGGRKNYIFWAGNFPTMLLDKSKAINIRQGIGYENKERDIDFQHVDTIILPVIPKSYIKYSYNLWPGCTSRNDSGFNVIRRLEKKDNFDYDFYIFPSENTITQIFHEYVDTSINIVLDKNDRNLVIPQLASEWYGKIEYHIQGYGGTYKLTLNKGVKIKLTDDSSNNQHSKWIIDISQLDSSHVEIKSGQLIVDGIIIDVDSSSVQGTILFVDKNNEIQKVTFSSQQMSILSEDEKKWKEGPQGLTQHLQHYSEQNQNHGQYVVIENHQYNNENVGRAFYEVSSQRYIFISSTNENKQNAVFSTTVGQKAYFYLPEQKKIWEVDIATGVINAEYQLENKNNRNFEILQLWKGDGHIYFSCRYSDTYEVANFQLKENQVELLGLNADSRLLMRLAETPTQSSSQSPHSFLQSYMLSSTYKLHGQQVQRMDAILGQTVTISGIDGNQASHRYWLRKTDGLLIKPNLSPSLGYGETPTNIRLHQSHWPIPSDLILVGSLFDKQGTEVFYFYSKKNKEVYRQEGAGQDVLNVIKPTAWFLNTPFNLQNVVFLQGKIFMSDGEGIVSQIDAEGKFHVVAINEIWLNQRAEWWKVLGDYYCCQPIMLIGLHDSTGQASFPGWFVNGEIVIAHELSLKNDIKFLGFDEQKSSALLFDSTTKKLYRQPVVSESQLRLAFAQGSTLLKHEELPSAEDIYPNLQFANIKQVGHGLLLSAVSGEIIYIDILENNGMRMGSSLVIRSGKENDVLSPSAIKNVKNIVLSAGEGEDTYLISQEVWQHYHGIIIDNNSHDLKLDTLILPIENIDELLVNQHGDDLLITDVSQNTVLVLRQVFGEQKASHQHLQLRFINQPNSIPLEEFMSQHLLIMTDDLVETNISIPNYSAIESDVDISLLSGYSSSLEQKESLGISGMQTEQLPQKRLYYSLLNSPS